MWAEQSRGWARDALVELEKCGVTRMTGAAVRAQPLAAHGTNQHGEEEVTLLPPAKGNSQAYLLRRLARDAPEVLERVKSGEVKSARAAAIAAPW
jgi:hypothetical protein